jgi:thioester reductase-like protein
VSDPRVFFTGFPGFLGSALLERVLARGDGPVACLVQPRYLETARERAAEIVDDLDAPDLTAPDMDAPDSDAPDIGDDAIQLVTGDITEPDLGLAADWERFESVEEIYHLAAVYDLGVEQELAEAVNVRGTEHVLEFADAVDVEHCHYVSTCYVSGRYDGVFTEDHLQAGQSFNNHYEETKYRGEVAVQERMAEGLPATIYRPAIVVGDSTTGETAKLDGPYNMLRLLLGQPSWLSVSFVPPGASDAELNVVPRDFVVEAIAHLSDRPESRGEVFQLCDPRPLSVPRFVDVLAEAAGHRTITLPSTKGLARRSVGLLERASIHVDPHTMDYLDHPTRYACPKTTRALAGSGITVPPFETYADEFVAFAREHPELRDGPMV